MSLPKVPLLEVLENTWPPFAKQSTNGWIIREGAGGGKRVSSAYLDTGQPDITDAETAMQNLGQAPMFQLSDTSFDLDKELANRGYDIADPTHLLVAPIEKLLPKTPFPHAHVYAVWPPVHVMKEVWATGGTGPERLAVMERVKGPKTGVLARNADHPVGTGFVAIHKDIAMIHSVEVLADHRRTGVGRMIMGFAAQWAYRNGAKYFSLAVVAKNSPAQNLYQNLGMTKQGQYHYRVKRAHS